MKTIPLASQQASGAIEAYHVKLKMKLFDDSHIGALQIVDWLVHKLTTELHSSYWLDRYADENDTFQNVKDDYINSTSWHRASQIPDTDVTLDSNNKVEYNKGQHYEFIPFGSGRRKCPGMPLAHRMLIQSFRQQPACSRKKGFKFPRTTSVKAATASGVRVAFCGETTMLTVNQDLLLQANSQTRSSVVPFRQRGPTHDIDDDAIVAETLLGC
ncbi:zinc finger, SWIM-type containing protein [Tanacetum coccineum]